MSNVTSYNSGASVPYVKDDSSRLIFRSNDTDNYSYVECDFNVEKTASGSDSHFMNFNFNFNRTPVYNTDDVERNIEITIKYICGPNVYNYETETITIDSGTYISSENFSYHFFDRTPGSFSSYVDISASWYYADGSEASENPSIDYIPSTSNNIYRILTSNSYAQSFYNVNFRLTNLPLNNPPSAAFDVPTLYSGKSAEIKLWASEADEELIYVTKITRYMKQIGESSYTAEILDTSTDGFWYGYFFTDYMPEDTIGASVYYVAEFHDAYAQEFDDSAAYCTATSDIVIVEMEEIVEESSSCYGYIMIDGIWTPIE